MTSQTTCQLSGQRTRARYHTPRQGAIAVLSLLFLTVLIVVAAFGVELSMFMAEKAEMQRSADAAAVAACWEYMAQQNLGTEEPNAREHARTVASDVAGTNLVRLRSLNTEVNTSNAMDGDIVFGEFHGFGDVDASMTDLAAGEANAVTVRVRQTQSRNGEVTFTLGRLLGIESEALEVTAVAAVAGKVRGFSSPIGSAKLNLMPFAVKKELWDTLFDGSTPDNFSYDFETQTVTAGADGVTEINIYPHDTGASGNSGTVDIGSSGNSTADLQRQILEGVSADDLAFHGGKLEFDKNGLLPLNGDTGISAGMKAQISSVIGEPRVIMVYSTVTGTGNNATFTIIQFVGVRVLQVNFQGSKNKSKKLIIQPANVIAEYAIVSNEIGEPSEFVFAPPVIVK